MKPLLKWVGGKTQILSTVLAEFPRSMNSYHEPFLGGGSVLLGLLSSDIEIRGDIHASDINPHLINVYVAVRDTPSELIAFSRTLEAHSTEESYYDVRARFNAFEPKSGPEFAALFLYLNKTCFRGVYREGPHGFNVPFGHYKNGYKTPDEEILAMSPLLQRVKFQCQGFEQSLANVKGDDFVYLDPPYVPVSVTSFVGYVAKGFSNHGDLFDLVKKLPCGFTMSNSDMPIVRDAFADYTLKSITCRRAIHSQDPSSKVQELLITKSSQ
jgi:DNA adenine methylase